ncbi:MAG: S1C family serine protease [Acidimicrobiia bacterium]
MSVPSGSAELGPVVRAVAARIDTAVVAVGRDRRGSGIVVAEGRVLTNAHNLRDRTTLVTFAGGRTAQGRVHGSDGDGDLVVLEVDTTGATPLAVAAIGDGPGLGDLVLAAGRTADGLRLTAGLVSAVERSFDGPRGRRINGAVEHTAPMARGSSGGPLLDRAGRLLAINTHRLGGGFYLARAIDAALATRLADLQAGASIRPRRLGVALAPAEVAARLRRAVGLAERAGLLVRQVAAGSPAQRAGLREGDLLVAAGDRELTEPAALHAALETSGSEPLVLAVVRGAEELTVTVSFEEGEQSPA